MYSSAKLRWLLGTLLTVMFVGNSSETIWPSQPKTSRLGSGYDDQQMFIKGDIMLGGLFPISSYAVTSEHYGTTKCGAIQSTFVLQAEAFMLSIRHINDNLLKKAGYRLGALVLDECDNAIIGLQKSIGFIAGEIQNGNYGICDTFQLYQPPGTNASVIYGVTGGVTSVVSTRIEPIFASFCVPLISSYSTSIELDSTTTYPYFLRTVPSDLYQAKVTYDLLRAMNWTLVTVVYEDTTYGNNLHDMFQYYARRGPTSDGDANITSGAICIVSSILVPTNTGNFSDVVTNLRKTSSRVIVLFMDFSVAGPMFKYINNSRDLPKFQWVGTDGWSRVSGVVKGVESLLENAITIEYFSHEMPLITNHIKNLKYGDIRRSENPWLRSLFQLQNCCRICIEDYEDDDCKPYQPLRNASTNSCHDRPCLYKDNEPVQLRDIDAGMGRAYFVYEAIYAFATAFEALRIRYCNHSSPLICDDFYRLSTGSRLLMELKRVYIDDPQLPRPFAFLKNSGQPYYSIFQFRRAEDNRSGFRWLSVGDWQYTGDEQYYGQIYLKQLCDVSENRDDCIRLKLTPEIRAAGQTCFKDCQPHTRRTLIDVTRPICCWTCESCKDDLAVVQNGQCLTCELGHRPHKTLEICEEERLQLALESPLVWVLVVTAGAGMVATAAVAGVLVRHRRTPIVLLGIPSVTFVGLAAVGGLFASSIFVATRPCGVICALQWPLQSLCLTTAIGAVLIKVVRLVRISRLGGWRLNCVSPRAQLMQVCSVAGLQLAVAAVWLVLSDALSVRLSRVGQQETVAVCASTMQPETFVLFVEPLALLMATLIYATRSFRASVLFVHREGRSVVFGCATLLMTLTISAPCFLSSEQPTTKSAIQMATIVCCGYLLLASVFAPGAYLIVFRAENNNYDYFSQRTLSGGSVRVNRVCYVMKPLRRQSDQHDVQAIAKFLPLNLCNNCRAAVYQQLPVASQSPPSRDALR